MIFEHCKRATGSEPLDLTRHRPPDFAGKTVTLQGREYVIGEKIGEGPQGFAHSLINGVSGLAQHMIQIRPEYMDKPEVAFEASSLNGELTARLRATFRSKGEKVEIPFITVHRMNGGSFELHETGLGMFDRAPLAAELRAAQTFMARGQHADATGLLENFTANNPKHSFAISNLASCYAAVRDYNKALATCARAVDIDPNFGFYRGQQISIAINSPARSAAKSLFEDFQARYPARGDFDYYGVTAYLAIGEPAKAHDVLQKASLRNDQMQELTASVQKALKARERFLALEKQIQARSSANARPDDHELLQVLDELCTAYPNDPYIQANLALALSRAGQNQRAAGLLISAAGGFQGVIPIYCWANAGYCFLALSDLKTAFELFTITMKTFGGAIKISPYDVPRVAQWIATSNVVTESSVKAGELIERAIATCRESSMITAEVRAMANMLRTFEAQLT